ncbi:hypothetical protein N9C82_01740 [bacterium]|nr:hypothetical protein [bacterium]
MWSKQGVFASFGAFPTSLAPQPQPSKIHRTVGVAAMLISFFTRFRLRCIGVQALVGAQSGF